MPGSGCWTDEQPRSQATIATNRNYGTVMMPTTHDVTPGTLPVFTTAALELLAAGNNLLVVSKPRAACITTLVESLKGHENKVEFRFTMGSLDNDILKLFEPGAPALAERLEAVKIAQQAEFAVSISSEPMLTTSVDESVNLFHSLVPYTAKRNSHGGAVWLGKLRKGTVQCDVQELAQPKKGESSESLAARRSLFVPGVKEKLDAIRHAQTNDNIVSLYQALKDEPRVCWKDSITNVLAERGIALFSGSLA